MSHITNFSDVTLVPEDGKVQKAHKMVLPAGREGEKRAILSDFIFGTEILTSRKAAAT